MPCVARTTARPAVGPANHASDCASLLSSPSWLPPSGGRTAPVGESGTPVIADAQAEISRNLRRLRGWLIFYPSRVSFATSIILTRRGAYATRVDVVDRRVRRDCCTRSVVDRHSDWWHLAPAADSRRLCLG